MACEGSTIKNTVIQPSSDTSAPSTDSAPEEPPPSLDGINIDRALEHLAALQDIAANNGGNSAQEHPAMMRQWTMWSKSLKMPNYTVTQWPFSFSQYQILNDPELSVDSQAIKRFRFSIIRRAGELKPHRIGQPHHTACQSAKLFKFWLQQSDFAGFPSGSDALIQRGTCTFREKVESAQRLRFGGHYLQRGPKWPRRCGRRHIGRSQGISIPVMGASYAVGALLAGKEGVTLSINGMPL